ncbi:MAG: acetylesterase [Bacillota bacterium]|nr:MAG: acetylesterase [Bacillota bacterium]
MKIFSVNLYNYFNIKKSEGANGELTCYLHSRSKEVNQERVFPAMLIFPGGGYGYISEREGEPIAIAYMAKDFNTFVLNYSVSPMQYPTQLLEAYMALAYMRKEREYLQIDENKIAGIGFSAGAHLCALTGNFRNEEVLKKIDYSGNIKPKAIILAYPVISVFGGHTGSFENLCGKDSQLQQQLSVENLVTEQSSPAFIWSTNQDKFVPAKNVLLLASAYEKYNIPYSLHIWGRGGHGLSLADDNVFDTNNFKVEYITESIREWLPLSVEWLAEQGVAVDDRIQ